MVKINNRWAVRMTFYLEQIELAYLLEEKVVPKDEKTKE